VSATDAGDWSSRRQKYFMYSFVIELPVDEQPQANNAAGIAEHVQVPGERAFFHAIEHEATPSPTSLADTP
jgi:hypothetical protein